MEIHLCLKEKSTAKNDPCEVGEMCVSEWKIIQCKLSCMAEISNLFILWKLEVCFLWSSSVSKKLDVGKMGNAFGWLGKILDLVTPVRVVYYKCILLVTVFQVKNL